MNSVLINLSVMPAKTAPMLVSSEQKIEVEMVECLLPQRFLLHIRICCLNAWISQPLLLVLKLRNNLVATYMPELFLMSILNLLLTSFSLLDFVCFVSYK